MNIFVVDKDPVVCARALCDLRLNKMILETAQLLCTAYRYYYPDLVQYYSETIYKVTHENHPCSVWLRKDKQNYNWGLAYFTALYKEKIYRTNKKHLSYTKLKGMLYDNMLTNDSGYNDVVFDFNCSGVYPSTNDVFTDYKLCLTNKWLVDNRQPKFTKREMPSFGYYDLVDRRQQLVGLSDFDFKVAVRKLMIKHPLYMETINA